jgi:4-hydroxybenzoyl-CoA reductase subunit beta
MLRLEPFAFARPQSVDETLALLARHGRAAKLIAGGTDVMPNLKHGLYEPEVVIGLSDLAELRGVSVDGGGDGDGDRGGARAGALAIGAMTTLEEVESHPLVLARAPGLAQAARAVAGPTQRTMGTLGGNVCLDTRCVWINQTHFWRKALGYCLKKDGTVCHVVQGGKSCVAAASNDTATMLCALGATLELRSVRGVRTVAIRDFYKPDGAMNQRLEPDELLTRIRVPPPRSASAGGAGGADWSGYAKLRARNSIDFPKLSIAAAYATDSTGVIDDATVVVSAIAAVPRVIAGIADLARGGRADDPALIARLGEHARKVTVPLTNIDGDTGWRRAMVPVFVKRAFAAAQAATP